MTAKEAYTYTLVEINKLEAPSLLLEDFNYLFNKAVQQYINKSYNRYEMNQQATDDLRALKKTAELTVYSADWSDVFDFEEYYCDLPEDYLHILNCVVTFDSTNVSNNQKCYKSVLKKGMLVPARKLTSNIYPSILTNAYLKPSVKNPYFFINTRDVNKKLPEENSTTNTPSLAEMIEGSISNSTDTSENKNVLELKCGDTKYYAPYQVYIDYIKTPAKINLTESELDGQSDSQTLEFPDYVCYEIINELTKLILENSSDPRLQTNIPINQTIGVIPTKN